MNGAERGMEQNQAKPESQEDMRPSESRRKNKAGQISQLLLVPDAVTMMVTMMAFMLYSGTDIEPCLPVLAVVVIYVVCCWGYKYKEAHWLCMWYVLYPVMVMKTLIVDETPSPRRVVRFITLMRLRRWGVGIDRMCV